MPLEGLVTVTLVGLEVFSSDLTSANPVVPTTEAFEIHRQMVLKHGHVDHVHSAFFEARRRGHHRSPSGSEDWTSGKSPMVPLAVGKRADP